MNIEELKNTFRKHVENYDMSETAIIRRFYHTYRVMDLCILLAKHNNFNEENTEIAILIGLLHDYARFEQWTKYKTFSDMKSIDHGDLAVEKLFDNNEIVNYCTNKKYYDVIYDAIKYHNKYSYPANLSEHNKLLCDIIRDADKLDIFYLLGISKNFTQEDNEEISEKVKENFYNNKMLNRADVKNKNDNIVLHLAMIFDLNFRYSYEYLYRYEIIDGIFEKIENKERFKPYFDYISKYIEERIR